MKFNLKFWILISNFTILGSTNFRKAILEKKFWKKNFGQKNFNTKIFITKIYKYINNCDTIFALLAPFDENREKDREWWKSLRHTHSALIQNRQCSLALHARNVAISTKSGKNIYHGSELSEMRLPNLSGAWFIDDREILVQGYPLRCRANQLVPQKSRALFIFLLITIILETAIL